MSIESPRTLGHILYFLIEMSRIKCEADVLMSGFERQETSSILLRVESKFEINEAQALFSRASPHDRESDANPGL